MELLAGDEQLDRTKCVVKKVFSNSLLFKRITTNLTDWSDKETLNLISRLTNGMAAKYCWPAVTQLSIIGYEWTYKPRTVQTEILLQGNQLMDVGRLVPVTAAILRRCNINTLLIKLPMHKKPYPEHMNDQVRLMIAEVVKAIEWGYTKLEYLTVREEDLTRFAILTQPLLRAAKDTLKYLHLYANRGGTYPPEGFKHADMAVLKHSPHLEEICIDFKINENHLEQLLEFEALRHLKLIAVGLQPEVIARNLSENDVLPRLKTLGYLCLWSDACRLLKNLPISNSIEIFETSYYLQRFDGPQLLQILIEKLPSVRELRVTLNNMGNLSVRPENLAASIAENLLGVVWQSLQELQRQPTDTALRHVKLSIVDRIGEQITEELSATAKRLKKTVMEIDNAGRFCFKPVNKRSGLASCVTLDIKQ